MPGSTWDDEEGQWWRGDCIFTVNGVTREYYQPPARKRPRDQQIIWNVYPIHLGGLTNVLLGDGSVRGVSNNIDLRTWSAMVTPSSGESESLQ